MDDLRKKNRRIKQKQEIGNIIHPKFTKDDVNPERRNSLKATAAEETLIAVLLQHPDFYSYAKEKLPQDKFVTSLNKRIYGIICETLDEGRNLDISVFAQKLLPSEVGYLVSLQNGDKAGNNPKTVLKDCIEVILKENMLLNCSQPKDLSVEDWATKLQDIINNKKAD